MALSMAVELTHDSVLAGYMHAYTCQHLQCTVVYARMTCKSLLVTGQLCQRGQVCVFATLPAMKIRHAQWEGNLNLRHDRDVQDNFAAPLYTVLLPLCAHQYCRR